MGEFRREIKWEPGYDRRSEGMGQHCLSVRFLLKGEKGTIQFLLMTSWYLDGSYGKPLPADVGCHSLTPQHEGQRLQREACEALDGRPCYYDGSGLAADKVFERLVREGEEGVWDELERFYRHWLENEPVAALWQKER
jgi:hypothetical protein